MRFVVSNEILYFSGIISYVFLEVFFNIAWNVLFNKLEFIQKILLKYMMSVFYDGVSISPIIGIIIMVSYITCR